MSKRQQIAFGATLLLIGTALFARQYLPALEPFLSWPLLLVPLGLLGMVSAAILQQGGWLISLDVGHGHRRQPVGGQGLGRRHLGFHARLSWSRSHSCGPV